MAIEKDYWLLLDLNIKQLAMYVFVILHGENSVLYSNMHINILGTSVVS